MKQRRILGFATLAVFASSTLLAQAAEPAQLQRTFRIAGKVTDANEAVIVGAKVTFKSEQMSKVTTTNERGSYEADLPLGSYTMVAEGPRGFKLYSRPLFRVQSPVDLTFDITLFLLRTCDPVVVGPATTADLESAQERCPGSDVRFLIPAKDGTPFQLLIRSGGCSSTGSSYTCAAWSNSNYGEPVFVDYDLSSLRADKILYDAKSLTIQASGHVKFANDLTEVLADSMTLTIDNGRLVPDR